MKAEIGDYLKIDGLVLQIVSTDPRNDLYWLENGGVVGDDEISFEDILLESEVLK